MLSETARAKLVELGMQEDLLAHLAAIAAGMCTILSADMVVWHAPPDDETADRLLCFIRHDAVFRRLRSAYGNGVCFVWHPSALPNVDAPAVTP